MFFAILFLVLLVVQVFFWIQLTEVGIHVLNPGAEGFLVTANPFAWILVFLLIGVCAFVIRFCFGLVNILATALIGSVIDLATGGASRKPRLTLHDSMSIAAVLVAIGWLIGSIFITAAIMGHFAVNPQLNGWLSDGSWLAHVLIYLGVFGLVCPREKSDS